ncbi:MAG: hypothetical protein K0R73_895 [Candidatus Midichloriaceae bacterium]|jgi:hypothetical protein|nr:hypothetical protein [Candidatus Midichloriaceae bacterium]
MKGEGLQLDIKQLANKLLSFFVNDDWDEEKLAQWNAFIADNHLLSLEKYDKFHECTASESLRNNGQFIDEDFRLTNIPTLVLMQGAPFKVVCDLFDHEIIPLKNEDILEGNHNAFTIYQEYEAVKKETKLRYKFFKHHHYYEELAIIYTKDQDDAKKREFSALLFNDFKNRSQDDEITDEDKAIIFKEFLEVYIPTIYKLKDKLSSIPVLMQYFTELYNDRNKQKEKKFLSKSLKPLWPALIYHLWGEEKGWSHFLEFLHSPSISTWDLSLLLPYQGYDTTLDIFLTYVKEKGKMTSLEFSNFVNKVFFHYTCKKKTATSTSCTGIRTTLANEIINNQFISSPEQLPKLQELVKKYGLKELYSNSYSDVYHAILSLSSCLLELTYIATSYKMFLEKKLSATSSFVSTLLATTLQRLPIFRYDKSSFYGKCYLNFISLCFCYSFTELPVFPIVKNLYKYAPILTGMETSSPEILEKIRYLMADSLETLVDNIKNLNVSHSLDIFCIPGKEYGSLLSKINDPTTKNFLLNPNFKITSDLDEYNIHWRGLISPYSTCLTICSTINALFLVRSFTSKYVTGVRSIDTCLFQANRLINLALYPIDSVISLWCTTTHKAFDWIDSKLCNLGIINKDSFNTIFTPIISTFAFSFVTRQLDGCAQSYFMAQG